jgi:hypothetical protein
VITLIVLAPVVAELLGGSTPISDAYTLLLWIPIYGCGALLIREIVRRRGLGWPSILLLGAAYGFIEEGLALQSLFDPHIYGGLALWGGRILGINGVYTEVVIIDHAVWSVAVPILITELLFPVTRTEPYLRRLGTGVAVLWYLLGVAIVWVVGFFGPGRGYLAPVPLLSVAGLAVVVLGVIALGPPRSARAARTDLAAPSPWLVAAVGLVGSVAVLGLFPLGAADLAFMRGPLVAVPMLAAAVIATCVAVLITRWARARGWGDTHLVALAGGALVGHSLIGDLVFPKTLVNRVGLSLLIVLVIILVSLLWRRASQTAASRSLGRGSTAA